MGKLGHIYFEEQGAGPALVLLHGHTQDHRVWATHAAALAARYRVITPDLAGHGRSGRSPEGAPLCCDLAALLDHLGVDRAAVLGLSMGGAVAVSFALHHSDRCAALLPVDAALYGHPFTQWAGPAPYVKQAQSEGLAPALEAWLSDPLLRHFKGPEAERLAAIVREYPGTDWLSRPPYKPFPPGPAPEAERLGEIAAPTLVMVGEHDLPDFQAIADRLAAGIPGARKWMVEGAGHLAPFEQPERFRERLLEFLQEVPGWEPGP
ncbi:MAG: alpha/beta fold hydrolase [Bacillota bacterium]